MKKIILPLFVLIFFLSFNEKNGQKFYSEKFKWEIIIPEEFELFETKIIYENNKEMYYLKYFRLIDNYDFVINLSYIDKDTGKKMIKSVLTSKFRS